MNETVSGEVREYVVGVRAALGDLAPEDVEEFTLGMEADLGERLAEPGEGTLRDRVGEPAAYAAELRSAAGLPPRAAVVEARESVGQRVSARWRQSSTQLLDVAPWLRDLRPLWWAARGFALAALPCLVLGVGIFWLGVLGALASVATGLLARHGRLAGGWVAPVRIAVNLVAVILLPVALLLLVDGASRRADVSSADPQYGSTAGLTNNGEQVTNLYAYDETGRRVDKVRLLDQNGATVRVGEDFVYQSGDLDALDQLRDPRSGEVMVARDIFPLRWDDRTGWEAFGDSGWQPPLAIQPLPGPVPSVQVDVLPDSGPEPASPLPVPTPRPSPSGPTTSPSAGVSATSTPTPSASPSASR